MAESSPASSTAAPVLSNIANPPLIVITGATGFIGNELFLTLSKRLKATGNPEHYRFRVIIRSPQSILHEYRHFRDLALKNQIDVYYTDLSNERGVERALTGRIHYIFHCAARGGDWGPKEEFWPANVEGTKNMLTYAKNCPELKRFLHVSTIDVYPHSVDPEKCTEDLEGPYPPGTKYWYTETKSLAEKLALDAHRIDGLPVTVIRMGAVFGPGSYSYGLVEAQILHKRRGLLVGGGSFPSGVIFIDDAVECLIAAAFAPNTVGQIYNAAANFDVTWREFYNALARGIQANEPWVSIPVWLARFLATLMEWTWTLFRLSGRPYFTNFLLRLIAKPQLWPIVKAKRDFGWEPRVPFQMAMARHVDWLHSRPDLWRDLE